MYLSGNVLRVGRHACFVSTTRFQPAMLLSATVPKRPITSQGDTPKSAAEGLQTSIRTKNLARIHQDYNAYAQSAMGKKGQSTGPPIVSQAELIELLYALAASGR